ncbi:MAG TPA: sn-glycerol-3-phosphate ABC transporter ATP-binding protein UgpC, partial [Nordella sp.]|nr:sn-glycerol-3-phosphate ABC transporter ATP-binding protein UgpC [Nordella sp.]
PSGCGKSTLLRMIAGLEEVNEGTISIDGTVVNEGEPKDRDIAMVFQSYALYPQMKVKDNMSFSLRMRGLDKSKIKQEVDAAAGILALDSLLERFPRQLSGGQRQRVAMGRAIVRKPKVFLFDEPLSNLDAKLRVLMRIEIKALHQRLGTTAVYVTHDQLEAMTMADRVVVMHDGQIEQVGKPLELYDRPANLFVAGFIGSPTMNFIKGVVRQDVAGISIESEGTRLPVPAGLTLAAGRDVVFGIRPEHLDVVAAGQAVPAKVEVIEPTGAVTYIYARIGATPVCAAYSGRELPRPGQSIGLAPQLDRIHLFDAGTEARIG